MAEKIAGIYAIINTKNWMVYVGQSKDIWKRLGTHRSFLRKATVDSAIENVHLSRSFNKYGESNFEFCLIEQCSESDDETLTIREQWWIDMLGWPILFNIRDADRAKPRAPRIESCCPQCGSGMSWRVSEIENDGRKFCSSVCSNIAASNKMRGVKRPTKYTNDAERERAKKEARQKLYRENHARGLTSNGTPWMPRNDSSGARNPSSKKVDQICPQSGIVVAQFDCLKAVKMVGANRNAVSKASAEGLEYIGFYWHVYKEWKSGKKEKIAKSLRPPKSVISTNPKTGDVIVYGCARDAQMKGFSTQGIYKCCAGKQKMHLGLTWSYCESLQEPA